MALNFEFTEEQLAFKKSVKEFAQKVVAPGADQRDKDGHFDREVWNAVGAFGLCGLPIPEEYGGSGADIVTTNLAFEALEEGGRDSGLLLSLGAHVCIGAVPIWLHGTEEQKRKYLPKLCSGEWIGAFAITEPDAGSDAAGIKTTARREGDGWVLNGSKTFITNGPVADVISVVAVTDPDAPSGNRMSCFVIEPPTDGFEVGKELDKMGNRSSPTSELHFRDCFVPAGRMLGPEGSALWKVAFECFDWERTVMVASAIGGMEAQLAACIEYARERKAFGKPISQFEMIQDKLARMRVSINASRWLLYHAAWLKQEGKPHMQEASIAKYFVAEAAVQNALEAVQIFGGYGYIKEYPVERSIRDAKLATIGGGTSEIQKLIIARTLLGE
ncbi:MAG TPA: acyl-CoA dehydrogenase family protein [Actinomycetota bacterium]|nr:acyl-CoA dehydrogenase family protein [Actinomycetota bacterium]